MALTAFELGQRIRQAREGVGLPQQALADKITLQRTSVLRLEAGERQVTTLELLAISRALDVPLSFFIEERSEHVTSLREDRGPSTSPIEKGRFKADLRLDGWLRGAEALLEHGLLDRQEVPSVGLVDSEARAVAAAIQTRQFLSSVGPIPDIQALCESFGLYVFVETIEVDGASRSPEPGFGVAVIARTEPGRRRMTAAHELGHHILGDAYSSDVGGTGDERERWISAFAAELLLPGRELRERWAGSLREDPGDLWLAMLRVSSDYRVSWTVALKKAVSESVLTSAQARQLRGREPTRQEMMTSIGRDVREDLAGPIYGRKWTKAVMQAAHQSFITRARAEELLPGTEPFAAVDDVSL